MDVDVVDVVVKAVVADQAVANQTASLQKVLQFRIPTANVFHHRVNNSTKTRGSNS